MDNGSVIDSCTVNVTKQLEETEAVERRQCEKLVCQAEESFTVGDAMIFSYNYFTLVISIKEKEEEEEEENKKKKKKTSLLLAYIHYRIVFFL